MLRTMTNPDPPTRGTGDYHTQAGVVESFRGNEERSEAILTFEPIDDDAAFSSSPSSPSSFPRPRSRPPPISFADERLAPPQHRRQQTAPSIQPLRTNSRPTSPLRGHTRHQSEMPFTGDGQSQRRQEGSPTRFAGWLGGASTPPTGEEGTNLSPSTTPKSRRGMISPNVTPKSTTSGAQSRFGTFLASSVSALSTRLNANQQSPVGPLQLDDELFNMDIEAALSPAHDGAAFSPAAYKNLQTQTTGLLLKMQNAYRQRTIALHEMQAERSAEKEDAEEARMRVDNLRAQLEHMALKAAEQEASMRALMSELNAERRARHEERMTREKMLTDGSLVNEDLGVDEARRKNWAWRQSGESSNASFDTDEESAESESVFSRSRSPTILTSAAESVDLPGNLSPHPGKVPTLGLPSRPKSGREMTTFQKLMKNISGETLREADGESQGGCKNCKGQDASVAWDTVSLLRDENKGLKQRVATLEVAVEGALDLVNGIGA